MDTLVARITDLAYEIFGILAPGILALAVVIFLWVAAGELIPWRGLEEALGSTNKIIRDSYGWVVHGSDIHWSLMVPGLIVSYLLGHSLKFAAKAPARHWWPTKFGVWLDGGAMETKGERFRAWVARRLFAPTTPKRKHSDHMEPMLSALLERYLEDGGLPTPGPDQKEQLPWDAFFPVARARIYQLESRKSLLLTFQSNYTFHRSLATLATITMWVSLLALLMALLLCKSVSYASLIFLTVAAFWAKLVFAANYDYFWGKWGDQVIAEAYALEIGRAHVNLSKNPNSNESGNSAGAPK